MATSQQEIQAALEAYKSGQATDLGVVNPDLAKANPSQGWNTGSGVGFQAYNLVPVALLLFPQLTPFRNTLARTSGMGLKSEYRAITGINTAGLQGFIAEGSAAPIVSTQSLDVTASYKSMALADKVTFESQWAGRGFIDAKSMAVTNLLRAQMIAEENALLFAQNSSASSTEQSPGAVTAPAPAVVDQASPVGGNATTTYYVVETVVTGMGESLKSAQTSVSATSGHSLKITPAALAGQPVLGYKLYIGTVSGGPYFEILPANISGGSLSNGVVPGGSTKWYTNGDALNVTSIPGSGNQPPASDGSSSALAFNGIYTQMIGGSGATVLNQGGALTNTGLTNVFSSMWANAKADPDIVYSSATESIKITNITLGAANTPYFVQVDNTQGATANYRVARLTNPVTGSEVPVRVHPTLSQGTMLFLSTAMPSWYVPTDVSATMDMNLVQDYVEIDYPPTQSNPYWQVEVRMFGTPRLFLPSLQGTLQGINNQ